MFEKLVNEKLMMLQPCSKELGYKLTQLGGNIVAISLDPLSDRFIREGTVYNQQPILNKMKEGMCHVNIWELYKKHSDYTIHTGYVLVQNVWYRHSWLIDHEDNIVETTYPTNDVSMYFGIWVSPEEFLDLLLRMGLIHMQYQYGLNIMFGWQ